MGKNVIVTSFMTSLEALCFSVKRLLQPSKKKKREIAAALHLIATADLRKLDTMPCRIVSKHLNSVKLTAGN